MTMNKSNAGNGLLVAIAIIVLVGAAVAGFMFYKKNAKPMDALPEASEIATTAEEPAVPQEPVATDEHGDAVPSTVEETPAASTEAVNIDVEKAMAPRIIGKAGRADQDHRIRVVDVQPLRATSTTMSCRR
jgi:hypothetical protein